MGVDTILQRLPTFQTSSEVYSAEVYLFRVLYPVMAKCDQPIASQRATVCKISGRYLRSLNTQHLCWTIHFSKRKRYVPAKGEAAPGCEKFATYYRLLCPGEWMCSCKRGGWS
ncbi:uncharacterized protein [Miscanthus floridulus]|uniref:uncharacterized protein isoform X4 n=1 Tax=Miscanthus floridulus TaxID=154761 RepID=UPI0034580967